MTAATAVTACATIATALIAYFALATSWHTQDQLNQQTMQQNASKVYVGEAPKYAYTYAYTHHLMKTGYEIINAVVNASGAQIDNVRVEGKNGTWDNMGSVQACSAYALPNGFKPVTVYFTDPYGQWRRTLGAGPEPGSFTPPNSKPQGSPWWLDIPYCP